MTKLTARTRGLTVALMLLAAVAALGVTARPARATVTFADQTYAQTWSGTCNSYLHEVTFNVYFSGSGTVWQRIWLYDLDTGRYTLDQDWEQNPNNQWFSLRFPSFRGNLAVRVQFARWVGYWDYDYEWVVLRSGGEYGQDFYYCPMP
jgi:hypothetical protein